MKSIVFSKRIKRLITFILIFFVMIVLLPSEGYAESNGITDNNEPVKIVLPDEIKHAESSIGNMNTLDDDEIVRDKDGYWPVVISDTDKFRVDDIEFRKMGIKFDFNNITYHLDYMDDINFDSVMKRFDFKKFSHRINIYDDSMVFECGNFNNIICLMNIGKGAPRIKPIFDFTSIYPQYNSPESVPAEFCENIMFPVGDKYILSKKYIYYRGKLFNKYVLIDNEKNISGPGSFKFDITFNPKYGYSLLDITKKNNIYYLLLGVHKPGMFGIENNPSSASLFSSPDLSNWKFVKDQDPQLTKGDTTSDSETISYIEKKYEKIINSIMNAIKTNVPELTFTYYGSSIRTSNQLLQAMITGRSADVKIVNQRQYYTGKSTYVFLKFNINRVASSINGNGWGESYPLCIVAKVESDGSFKLVYPFSLSDKLKRINNAIKRKIEFQNQTSMLFIKLDKFYNKSIKLSDEEVNQIKNKIITSSKIVYDNISDSEDYDLGLFSRNVNEIQSDKYLTIAFHKKMIQKVIPDINDNEAWKELSRSAAECNGTIAGKMNVFDIAYSDAEKTKVECKYLTIETDSGKAFFSDVDYEKTFGSIKSLVKYKGKYILTTWDGVYFGQKILEGSK